jgi:hypothetical protein
VICPDPKSDTVHLMLDRKDMQSGPITLPHRCRRRALNNASGYSEEKLSGRDTKFNQINGLHRRSANERLAIGEPPQSHHKTSIRRKVTMLFPVLLKQRCAESPSSPGDDRGPVAHSYFAACSGCGPDQSAVPRRRRLNPTIPRPSSIRPYVPGSGTSVAKTPPAASICVRYGEMPVHQEMSP